MIAKGVPNKKIGIREKRKWLMKNFPQNLLKQLKI
jgi:hypothetical protein